jgi:hypothetical protein
MAEATLPRMRVYQTTLAEIIAFSLRDRAGFEAWWNRLPWEERDYILQLMEQAREAGIAVAFVATMYGVGLANLVFLPAAGKLKLHHKSEIARLNLMMEGALAIQEGQNPNLIAEKLSNLGASEEPSKKGERAPRGVPAEAR